MTATADASFLVSLYGGDVHTGVAAGWMAAHATPLFLTPPLRFETENALRLARFRNLLPADELQRALTDIANDLAVGILVARQLPADRLWRECQRLSTSHTLVVGSRAFDILHVAAALLLKADTLLSFDARQRSLATACGLRVEP